MPGPAADQPRVKRPPSPSAAPPARPAWRRRLGAAWLALALAAGPVAAASDAAARLPALRQAVTVDPQTALDALAEARRAAIDAGDLATRLAIDEIACRALGDIDAARGLAEAQVGLAAAGPQPPAAARTAWLRLRTCRVSVQLDLGLTDAAQREIDTLLQLPDSGETAVPRALALMERGVWRSRRGALLDGQADLLAACERLQQSTLAADRDLCAVHLSSHHRRMGDTDEAIRLLQPLLAAAERSGAHYDASVYIYALARAHQERSDWPAAREAYARSLQASELLRDANGIAYAEHGLARALLETGEPAQALPHARRALEMVAADADPRETLLRTVTLAEAQTRLGQHAAARATLDRVADAVRGAGHAPNLAAWLAVRADVAAGLGLWPEAHAALAEARRIELGLHQQQLSEQAGRLRQQFNRARDAEELTALRLRNEQGRRLRETQALATVLALLLGGGAAALAAHKVRQARRLKLQSETDELTGLANRRALQAFALRLWRRPAGLAVLAVDVDHFKQVNDSHGHAAGDRVLQQLAATLARFMRSSDRVGRIGGEEFVAVLAGADARQAREVAERIRAAVAANAADGGAAGAIPVTISIGLAVAEAGDASFDQLLARADAALYQAKAEGRNRVCEAGSAAAHRPAAERPGAAVSAGGR